MIILAKLSRTAKQEREISNPPFLDVEIDESI